MVDTARTKHHTTRFSLGVTDDKLLRVLARYECLTPQQATRLLYSAGSLKYVWERLRLLSIHKYVLCLSGRTVGLPAQYTLATKGRQYVTSLGIAVSHHFRPSEQVEKTQNRQFRLHDIAVTDVLINMELLTRAMPHVVLNTLLHDRELKRKPVYVTLPDGTKRGVIPDCLADVDILASIGRIQQCSVTEVDLGTEERKQWQRKVAAYIAFSKGAYQQAYGNGDPQYPLTIPVFAIPGTARRDELIRWTEAELERLGEMQRGQILFRFTDQHPEQTMPLNLWATPVWYVPFQSTPVSLLAKEAESP